MSYRTHTADIPATPVAAVALYRSAADLAADASPYSVSTWDDAASAAEGLRRIVGSVRPGEVCLIDEDGDGLRVTTLDTRTDDVDGELRRVAEAKEARVRDGEPTGESRTR